MGSCCSNYKVNDLTRDNLKTNAQKCQLFESDIPNTMPPPVHWDHKLQQRNQQYIEMIASHPPPGSTNNSFKWDTKSSSSTISYETSPTPRVKLQPNETVVISKESSEDTKSDGSLSDSSTDIVGNSISDESCSNIVGLQQINGLHKVENNRSLGSLESKVGCHRSNVKLPPIERPASSSPIPPVMMPKRSILKSPRPMSNSLENTNISGSTKTLKSAESILESALDFLMPSRKLNARKKILKNAYHWWEEEDVSANYSKSCYFHYMDGRTSCNDGGKYQYNPATKEWVISDSHFIDTLNYVPIARRPSVRFQMDQVTPVEDLIIYKDLGERNKESEKRLKNQLMWHRVRSLLRVMKRFNQIEDERDQSHQRGGRSLSDPEVFSIVQSYSASPRKDSGEKVEDVEDTHSHHLT